MEMLWLTCRRRFTGADWEFLAGVVSPGAAAESLDWLWEDPEGLREVLDLRVVLRALVDAQAPLEVSAALYFYVLVRHAFLRAGIEEVALADYVAGILAERATLDPQEPLRGVPGGLTRVADFIAIIETAHGRVRYELQVEAGKQFLLLTGMFPEFLRRRAARSGAPDLEFYESFGAQSFRQAADNPLAPDGMPRLIFARLAECFSEARRTLNRLSSDTLFLGT
jgi:hypothetical protein